MEKSIVNKTLLIIITLVTTNGYCQTSLNTNHDFSFELLRAINKTGIQNLTFSPYSIQQAIGITYDGAVGQTKLEINNTLHFNNFDKIGPTIKKENEAIVTNNKNIKVSIANGIWAQKDFKFNQTYFKSTEENFDACVNYTNYQKQKTREKTAHQINHWVDQKTHGNINQLLQPGDLSKDTRLVLVNAIWLKANWDKPFEKANTQKASFYNYDGSESTVELMNQKGRFNYVSDDFIQLAELPYTDHEYTMLVILPNDNVAFDWIIENANSEYLQQLMLQMHKEPLVLEVPKFKSENQADLKPLLTNMGMKLAFTDSADFSEITGKADLKIDEIIHKAIIEVDETGTEAAAATAVIMVTKTAILKEINFRADKPFIYLVKNNKTNQILFIGQFVAGS